jgi:hypothetical protein
VESKPTQILDNFVRPECQTRLNEFDATVANEGVPVRDAGGMVQSRDRRRPVIRPSRCDPQSRGRISDFVERFAIILVVDAAGSQDLFQRRPFHLVVIGNGDNLSGGADKNDVLSVLPAFKAELPLEYATMLLPARKGQVGE